MDPPDSHARRALSPEADFAARVRLLLEKNFVPLRGVEDTDTHALPSFATERHGIRVGFEVKFIDREIHSNATRLGTYATRLRRSLAAGSVAILIVGFSMSTFLAECDRDRIDPEDATRAIVRAATRIPGFDGALLIVIEDEAATLNQVPDVRLIGGYTSARQTILDVGATFSGALGFLLGAITDHGDGRRRPAEPRERTRTATRYLLMASELSTGNGGMSSFNLEFARALVRTGKQVCVAVPHVTEAEIDEAREQGILVAVPKESIPGVDGPSAFLSGLRLLSRGQYAPDVVVGHGRILGPYAYAAQSQYRTRPLRLHIVHMDPEQLELAKEPDYGKPRTAIASSRRKVELELSTSADLVAGVGDRLSSWVGDALAGFSATMPPVLTLIPGVPEWPAIDLDRDIPKQRSFLFCGRVEDFAAKGLEIAVRAVGIAKQLRPGLPQQVLLVLRGVPTEHADTRRRVDSIAAEYGLSVVFREFTVDRAELATDLASATALLMPSIHEGFGLSAYEAIGANVPVLISAESGLRDLLVSKTSDGAQATPREILPVGGPNVPGRWAAALCRILDDPAAAFARASDLRAQLVAQTFWERSIDLIDDEVGRILSA